MNTITITYDTNDIALLHMHDEKNKNMFSHIFVNDFLQALDSIEQKSPKVIILQGLTDVFCSGADKDSLIALANGQMVVRDLLISERLLNCRIPIIAAMQGHAIGGGLVLGLCSDIVLAAHESRYGMVFMNMGFTPGMGSTTLLQGLVGEYIANEMLFSGKRFKGSELAQKATNINYILTKKNILPQAFRIARLIAEKQRDTLYMLKYNLSAKKRKLLIDARMNEDMMHAISFSLPETKKMINEIYIHDDTIS